VKHEKRQIRYTENGVITTLEFGIDNISVEFRKLLRSFFGQMNFSRIKTRIKIIQKIIRVFQYPHCVEATT
jgi:hypothetical protein